MNNFTNFYCDYVGSIGESPINDYIRTTSNILSDRIDNIDIETSNISSNISSIYSNNLRNELWEVNPNNSKCLIKTIRDNNIYDTYIINGNIDGEIRFKTLASAGFNLGGLDHNTKLDYLGRLKVYHNYDLTQPTILGGWYDVDYEIAQLKADGVNTDIQLTVLDTAVADIQAVQLPAITTALATYSSLLGNTQIITEVLTDELDWLITNDQLGIIRNRTNNYNELAQSLGQYQNAPVNFISKRIQEAGDLLQIGSIGAIGFGLCAGLGALGELGKLRNFASNVSPSNFTITPTQRRQLIDSNTSNQILVMDNIFNNTSNINIIQGFINSNITNQQFIPLLNTNELKFNNVDLFDYLPYQSPTPSGVYTTTTIDANTFVYTFTGTGQLIVPRNTIVDILLVGAGGRGGMNIYSGGGGAGEVVYYPQYAITAGTYDITIGVDSSTTANRISKITKAGVNQLVALGGGDGAYWNYEFTAERTFPPKAYNTATARSASTIMGRSCQKYTMTLNTTGITYGSGTYELYVSSVNSTSTSHDGYRMFDFDNTTTINRWACAAGQYTATTGAPTALNTQYFIDNTYKGDWFVIKLPYPIALTKYTIYQTTGYLDRSPKNFKVYGSITGTSFDLLQTITGATYTSRIYTNTGLSTNTTPYQWYAFVVNNLVGGTNSTLLDIVEFKLYGKEPINVYSSSIGGSGGGGWYNPNVPALVKKGSTFAISQNAQYSKATAGYNPVDTPGSYYGGSGGSSTGTGRFETTITGTTTSYGLGGYPTGGTAYATPVATNYGDGGSSGLTQGLAFQGICIIRISTGFISVFNHFTNWNKLLNIQVGDGLFVDALNNNKISTSWSKNLLTNDIYNNNGGNVGINVYNTTSILEKLHIGDLGGQKGKFLLGTDYDHLKISHDGYICAIDVGGADSYFSIRMDYPPDWTGYNSMYYYDILTILGDGSGFVGIQNTAPTCAFDVIGAIKCSGNLTAGGDLNCRNAYFNNQNISGITTATITQLNGTAISLSGSMNVPTIVPTYINSCSTASIATLNSTTINATTFNGLVNFTNGSWNTSADGKLRMYFAANSHSYWGTYNSHIFRNATDADIVTIDTIGNITCAFETISTANTDHLGILFNSPSVGTSVIRRMCSLLNTFTGYHRCFIEDEKFDINDWENFRKEYEGRVVISSGKIKTHLKDGEEVKEWTAFSGKDGITIEDALPIIELSRKKKDKRIYGVLGSYNRGNSANDRMIINGCGEGAIWVVNSNGNIENGDLLQTSDHLGYAERQDDNLIRNYTIGKVVMDCNFELDSPEYRCEDLGNGIRRAFLACVYMSA